MLIKLSKIKTKVNMWYSQYTPMLIIEHLKHGLAHYKTFIAWKNVGRMTDLGIIKDLR